MLINNVSEALKRFRFIVAVNYLLFAGDLTPGGWFVIGDLCFFALLAMMVTGNKGIHKVEITVFD
jgi:hypothetical protein